MKLAASIKKCCLICLSKQVMKLLLVQGTYFWTNQNSKIKDLKVLRFKPIFDFTNKLSNLIL